MFSDWLFENRIDTDGTALRHWVQKKIKADEAAIIESAMVTAKSGLRAICESVTEYTYPTEYDPPAVSEKVKLSGQTEAPVTPPNATAFETRNVGTTLEVDPFLDADNVTVDLNFAPEVVALDGHSVWPNEELDEMFQMRMPTFYTMRITTQVTVMDGRYTFLGTARPRVARVEGVAEPVALAFVRVDVGVLPWPKSKLQSRQQRLELQGLEKEVAK